MGDTAVGGKYSISIERVLRMKNQNMRRDFLKIISGAPLLPFSSSIAGVSAFLTSSISEANAANLGKNALFSSVSFSNMAAPNLSDPAQMATTSTSSVMTVNYQDGSRVDYALAYEPFFLTGTMVPNGKGGKTLAGAYYDISGSAIMDTSGESPRPFFSDGPDGTSFIVLNDASTVPGISGKAVYSVVQFEYTTRNLHGNKMHGKLPSPIAVLTLDQNQATGKLTLVKYSNVDTASAHGLWITCGSSLSPWNTHLSSEEYEPDARTISSNAKFKGFIQNLYGDAAAIKDPLKANPYFYGHLPEVKVQSDGTGSITKHYCLGRISHELVEVMPDHRTVLMGDDINNGGYFMFIADSPRDLSAGTLYVAKLNQELTSVSPSSKPTSLEWIKLGHASSAEIETLATTLNFSDIMSYAETDPMDQTYSKVYLNGEPQWVKVKPGREKAAAFLETHRYAAIRGGSMGFSKMEGTTLNAADKVIYSALSACRDSMVKGDSKHDLKSMVNLPKALKAGAVMELRLSERIKDANQNTIDSEWVPISLQAVLNGEDLAKPDELGNTANPNKIANPDNLKFDEKMRTLFIGEDSTMHINNFLWAYNVDTKTLSRILSCPAGAESTGLQACNSLHGWTYITSNFQHAGDWGSVHKKVQSTLEPLIRANYDDRYSAAVGYLTSSPLQMKIERNVSLDTA
jgi:uncharacterized protein